MTIVGLMKYMFDEAKSMYNHDKNKSQSLYKCVDFDLKKESLLVSLKTPRSSPWTINMSNKDYIPTANETTRNRSALGGREL